MELAASPGFAPGPTGSKPGMLLLHHEAVEARPARLVEPEVVATSPRRIKSPVPVCCGFDSVRMVLAAGVAPALATLSTSCLFCWTTRAACAGPPLDPRVGAAPTGFLYKRNPEPAAWRQGGWYANGSQSPVLPRTRRAYETHLRPGSTAKWIRHPELHRADSHTERMHR